MISIVFKRCFGLVQAQESDFNSIFFRLTDVNSNKNLLTKTTLQPCLLEITCCLLMTELLTHFD